MFRYLLFALIAIFVLTFIRMAAGIFSKAAGGLFDTPSAKRPVPPSEPTAGELKRDPVCGTFVPSSTVFQKVSGGQTHYFCSATCRDKHA